MEQIRINKYLAHCGVCSRREADKLIRQGAVTVDGETAAAGRSVFGTEEIFVSGKKVGNPDASVVLAFYKPAGVVCTERSFHGEKKITDVIRYPVRVTYAGRLDKDSEGLLLLTNDGNLIQGMMRGANRHEKEYQVRVDREITGEFLKKMSGGIYLEELEQRTRECVVEQTGKYTFRIILTQGLNRQIKRMCAACGYRVRGLKRIRVMHITLGELKPGEYRKLDDGDVERLYRDCGLAH